MRIFPKFPEDKVCPICKTNRQEECTLISIVDSNEEGSFTYKADVFHVSCIELWYAKDQNIIAQKMGGSE